MNAVVRVIGMHVVRPGVAARLVGVGEAPREGVRDVGQGASTVP